MYQMKTTEIKIVVCDLDHTLLHNDKKISEASIRYLIGLQQRGLKLVIATGRFYSEIIPYVKQLQLEKYGGYAITSNGTVVHNIKEKKEVSFETLKAKEIKELVNEGKKHHLNMYVHVKDIYYVQATKILRSIYFVAKFFIPLLRKILMGRHDYFLYRLTNLKVIKDISEITTGDLHKICFISLSNRIPAFEKDILAKFNKKYHFFKVSCLATELVKSSVSKRNATQYVCTELGYTMKNVIAFGDSGNDEALLESACIGVTMKNGLKQTLDKAKIISDKTNNEDGVIDYLRKLKIG